MVSRTLNKTLQPLIDSLKSDSDSARSVTRNGAKAPPGAQIR